MKHHRQRSSQRTSSRVFLPAHTLLKWRNLSTRCNIKTTIVVCWAHISYIITRPHALGQFTRTFLQTEMRGFLRTNLHHSRVGGKSWCGSQLRVSCLVYLTMTTILDNFVLHSIDLVIMYVWHFGKGLQNLFNLKVGLYNIQYLRYTYNIVLRTYLSFLRWGAVSSLGLDLVVFGLCT